MLLIGTDEGIYRWTEGNNWPVFHGLQDRVVVGLASPGGGFLAALDNVGRVWESGNNGQSWRVVPLPEGSGRPSALTIGGLPASILLAGPGPAVYRRMLGSSSRLGSPIELARRAAATIDRRARSIVARGRGGAATAVAPAKRTANLNGWTALGSPDLGKSPVRPEVRSIAATPGAWFASVVGEGLWRSADDGQAWSRLDGLPADVHSVRALRPRAGELVAATGDGVWFSADHGQTWESRSKGLESVRHVRAVESCPDEPNYLLAGACPAPTAGPRAGPKDGLGYGLYESRDAGKTWSRVLRSFPENLQFDAISDIRFDPAEPDHAAVAFESGEMWMTLNGGDYWQPFARDIRSARVLCPIG